MNQLLKSLQEFLKAQNLDGCIISSKDQYLSEFSKPETNARYILSGFSGSTGDMLVLQDRAYLFVDGRYHAQADREVFSDVEIVKLELGQTQLSEIIKRAKNLKKLGITSFNTSVKTYNTLVERLEGVEISCHSEFISESIQHKKKTKNAGQILKQVQHDIKGMNDNIYKNKLKKLGNKNLFISALDEIAYLTGFRGDDIPYSSAFGATAMLLDGTLFVFSDFKAIIERKGIYLLRHPDECNEVVRREDLMRLSRRYAPHNDVFTSFSNLTLLNFRKLQQAGFNVKELKTNPIAKLKSIKTRAELDDMKKCFKKTDEILKAVIEMAKTGKITTELEISEKLKELTPTKLSFEPIVAKASNTAIIHYTSPNAEKIKAGDLVLIDFGIYSENGYASDITRTFLVGDNPKAWQKEVYTKVLKAHLQGINFKLTKATTGADIDKKVRRRTRNDSGFSFNHSTGHGVGINVHEAPPSISPVGKTPLKNNMVFTIEPGLYKDDMGGVRLENSVYIESGKIKPLSFVEFDENLIDYAMLTQQEKKWLEDYQKSCG